MSRTLPDAHPLIDHFGRTVPLLLWENLPALFLCNLPVILLTGLLLVIGLAFGLLPGLLLPSLAFYPGWVALMGVVAARLLEQRGSAWEHFRRTLRREGGKAALFGLFLHGVGYGYLTTAAAYLANRSELAWLLLWIVESMIVFALALSAIYAFPLLALHGSNARTTLYNALLLALFAPWPALAMLAFVAMLVSLATWIGIGLWLAAPPAAAVLLVSNALLQIHLKSRSNITAASPAQTESSAIHPANTELEES